MSLVCFGHPQLDPVTQKAYTLPILNPFDRHGRVFFFAWFSFLISFLSWYSMSALLTVTIRQDLLLTDGEVLNSNIVAQVASLLVRLFAGFLCERFGPRKVLCAILVASALPCGLAGTITGPTGLYFIRFFMGIAGGSFVPAQVWVTAHFDKRVLGTSTACAAGWGDSGVGFTYFLMPAVFESFLDHHNHDARVAWRLAFLVPTVLLLSVSAACWLLCEDTPTGPWHARPLPRPDGSYSSASEPPQGTEKGVRAQPSCTRSRNSSVTVLDVNILACKSDKDPQTRARVVPAIESRRGSETSCAQNATSSSSFQSSSKIPLKTGLQDVCCLPTFLLASMYFATFGTSLVVNSFLVQWYLAKFPAWDEGKAGHWAAMCGLLNIISRPFGGLVADEIYRRAIERSSWHGLKAKQIWLCLLCGLQGMFALWISQVDPSSMATLLGGVAGFAFFMQAANGACYALLPHVNPHVNGLMGGIVGSSGSLGGITYSLVYRFSSIPKTLLVTGASSIALAMLVCAVNPVPKKERQTSTTSPV
ncbi:hypothetical protein OIV83_000449 [Microbotryomycetes sp. JL201]|nr:hypothetical protein OIV83_000449 [Microbotryomycetes sp. JL201]